MWRMIVVMVLCAAPVLAEPVTVLEPFGFVFGTKLEAYKDYTCTPTREVYFCDSAPKPVSVMTDYMLVFEQDQLARVAGVVTIRQDRTGVATRVQFQNLAKVLEAKYGKPKHDFDFLHAGSIWKSPGDFSMAMYKDERSLAKTWDLPEHTVLLRVVGLDSTSMAIHLVYESKALVKARAARQAAQDASGL